MAKTCRLADRVNGVAGSTALIYTARMKTRIALSLFAVLLLAGCGNKGPLFRQEPPPEAEVPAIEAVPDDGTPAQGVPADAVPDEGEAAGDPATDSGD